MTPTIDISSDVGERPDDAGFADDLELLDVVSSANVACGGHAGDRASMRGLCAAAVARGVAVGAQVSYVDRDGFGRRRLDVSSRVLTAQLRAQWEDLAEAAEEANTRVAYLRPHGALYNAALTDETVATAVLNAAPADVAVLCLAGTALARLAEARGHKVVTELFADRAIDAQGLLVPRGQPRSVIHDAADVHLRLLDWLSTGHLTSIDGARVRVRARSICIHSDTPGALAAARAVRATVEAAGARVATFATDS